MKRLDEHVIVKKKYCPECISEAVSVTEKIAVLESSDKNMEPVEYWLPQINCPECGTTSAFEAVDAMHDAACFARGILTPQQIKDTRKKYQMNTREFSTITAIPESTLKMCEARSRSLRPTDSLLIGLVNTHGPDLLYDYHAQTSLETGQIPADISAVTKEIFEEVASQTPNKLDRAEEESRDMLALLS